MLNKAKCPILKWIICKICGFLPCCLFLLRYEGFRHTGWLEAVGVEGGRGAWGTPSILMACHDCLWPVAWSHLESRQFAARAACHAAERHIKGIDSRDLTLKQEPLQNDSTDAPTLIYSSLRMLSRCFVCPRYFVPRCRQDLNLKIQAAGGKPLPGKPCGNLPQAELSSSQSPLVFVMYLIFACLTLTLLHTNAIAKASCTDKNWHVCTVARLAMLF